MKTMEWVDKHFEEGMLVVLLILIFVVQLLQVVARNLPFMPAFTWAEEFCRFCWIWSVFLSLPYTIRQDSMLRVTLLGDVLTKRAKSILNIIVNSIVAIVMAFLGYHAIGVVTKIMGSGETSPAMLWPMWIVYSMMLVGFFLGALRGLQQVWKEVQQLRSMVERGSRACRH